jgi:uncharacterized protein YprB with RNaseH-like and TPR domain
VEIVRARYALDHRHGRCILGEALEAMGAPLSAETGHTIWLDTETTGLAGGTGTYAFLVGLAHLDGQALITEQFLLRRLSAERHLLAHLADRLGRTRHLVTFNGNRFDWPILEARFVLARQRPEPVQEHTDLIHPARRLWHRVFGTHRLSALEAEVLGAPRLDDVPGWQIPMIYVQYLRSSDRAALEPVLSHNRADLLAMIMLQGEVARILRDPFAVRTPLDWEGAGVLLGRRGDHGGAMACLERAAQGADEPAARWRILRRLARGHRILHDEDGLRARWEKEAVTWTGSDRFRLRVLEEVAKSRERAGDYAGACRAACEALNLALSLFPSWPSGPSGIRERLTGRVARLEKRSARELAETADV